jgi:hypothetical protein
MLFSEQRVESAKSGVVFKLVERECEEVQKSDTCGRF